MNFDPHNVAYLIGFLCICVAYLCIRRTRNWLDLGFVSALGFAVFYCLVPLYTLSQPELWLFISETQASSYLLTSLAFCLAFFAGVAPRSKVDKQRAGRTFTSPAGLITVGLILATVSLVFFFYNVFEQGGLSRVYGSAYGGAWANSGYAREAPLLSLPAALFIALGMRGARVRPALAVALILVSVTPLLLHGFLGARRGYIFMAIAAVGTSLFLARILKPRFANILIGATVTGLLMLTFVSNRDSFFVGGDWAIESNPLEILDVREGQEFVFATAIHEAASQSGVHYFGGRYLTVVAIRPIPRQIWPDKYEDAAALFGTPNLEKEGQYVPDNVFISTVGWRQETGSAPGLIADVYLEFGAYGAIFMFVFGLSLRAIERRAHSRFNFVILKYATVGLLIYAIAQGFEPFIFRLLFTVIPAVILLRLTTGRSSKKSRARRSRSISVKEIRNPI